jgi:signal peptidase II
MSKRNKLILIVSTLIIGIVCDRVTKILAQQHLKFQPPHSYLNGFFELRYAENTGAALSLGDGLPQPYNFILLSILPIVFMIGMMYYVVRNLSTLTGLQVFSLALIVTGGLGNIIDRIMYDRHVTDFMIIGIGELRTGIFNVADMYVTAGAIGMILTYFVVSKSDKSAEGPT